MGADWPLLGELLDPLGVDSFFDEYRDRRLAVMARDTPDRFSELLDLETVERFIFESNPRRDEVQVLHEGPVDQAEYLYGSGLIDTAALGRLYETGHSIVLPQAQYRLPTLGSLVRGIEAELSCRAQTNVYLSPPGAAAFAPHHDTHDVVVLQAVGAKDWTIYEGSGSIPATRTFDRERDAVGDPSDRFTLHQGDSCYLPRGLVHHAAATDQPSLHITLGIHWTRTIDVVQAALDSLAEEHPEWRSSLPPRWWADADDQEQAVADVLATIESGFTPDALGAGLEKLRTDLVASRQPLLSGHFGQLAAAEHLAPDTVVTRRRPLLYEVFDRGETVVLSCYGSDIAFPAKVASALDRVLARGPVRLRDLVDPLDLDEVIVLVRRLVREGVVTVD